MMIIIGAIIGGLTNSLAIKMLFRPYEAKYIGKWKLPFTPGLIPKRREELAKQLGRMVVEHLLTAEGIRKKLNQAEFRQQMISWAQGEASRFIKKEITWRELLATIGVYINEEDLRNKIKSWTQKRYNESMASYRDKKVRTLLDDEWARQADVGIDQLTDYIQKQLGIYIASEDSNDKINNLVESYLGSKGFLGNMISSFLGNEGLADKIQPILVEYSQSEEAKASINNVITNEWNKLLDQPISKIEDKIGKEKVGETLGRIISTSIPLETWLNTSVQEWIKPVEQKLLYHILPNTVNKLLASLGDRIDSMMKQLGLEEIVENEVSAFPIKRVEQLVLNISGKEFKLITYLGALLGGLIGLVQGVIVILVG